MHRATTASKRSCSSRAQASSSTAPMTSSWSCSTGPVVESGATSVLVALELDVGAGSGLPVHEASTSASAKAPARRAGRRDGFTDEAPRTDGGRPGASMVPHPANVLRTGAVWTSSPGAQEGRGGEPGRGEGLGDRARDVLDPVRGHERDGRAAEAAPRHAGTERARTRRRLAREVELAARDLVVVAQRAVPFVEER